jgi:hypothetical protein
VKSGRSRHKQRAATTRVAASDLLFLMAGLDATGPSESTVEIQLVISAALAGVATSILLVMDL